ncbi:MAG: OPT/YSL family transporter [Planctomycetota bacterium]|nr:OPT/YSL family transporter [Planctomycetota bacterium]
MQESRHKVAPASPTDDRFSLIFGVIASTILAGSLVIAGLKAGITPGVSPLVILFAWGAFAKHVAGAGGTRFLNIAQVAGSAGMAVCAGVIFTAPVVQILYKQQGLPVPPVDWISLSILSLAGALIGFGFVGLSTKKFLSDPSLPAPEAHACETMIEAAASDPSKRPKLSTSLYLAMALGWLVPILAKTKLIKDELGMHVKRGDQELALGIPLDVMVIGIGGLLTIATALLVFSGAAIRLLGQFYLTGAVGADGAPLVADIELTMRWVGGGAMGVAVLWSLVKFSSARTSGESTDGALGILDVPARTKLFLRSSIFAGMTILFVWLVMKDGLSTFTFTMSGAVLVCAMLMVGLGAILSLQIGSSASPVSGTIFVTTLALCGAGLAIGRTGIEDVLLLTPLLVGACVAVCTANDSSQDYKTLQLCGVPVRDGFLAQFLGLILACVAVPFALYIAHQSYTLGSDALPAPQATMFAGLFDAILLNGEVPMTPVLIGALIGVVAIATEVIAKGKGIMLPAMALAVGIYLPAHVGIAILVGAFFRFLAEGPGKRQRGESILAAAGLITGAALLDLFIGVAIISFDFKQESLEVTGMDWWTGSGWITGLGCAVAMLVVGGVLYRNSLGAKPREANGEE